MTTDSKRLLLLVTNSSYRTQSFAQVAKSLAIELVYGIDMPKKLAELYHIPLALDFADIEEATAEIVELASKKPFDAILSVDDSGIFLSEPYEPDE